MLADCGLPEKWWAQALVDACHLKNVSTSTTEKKPWEVIKGESPDMSMLRVFGAPCIVKGPDEKRNKLEPKTVPGRLLWFDLPNTRPTIGVMTRSRDVSVQVDFESKADKRMIDLEMDTGITPTAPVQVPDPTPTSPPTPVPTEAMQPTAPALTDAASKAVETEEEAELPPGHRSRMLCRF
jgi:hypothetical protein